MEYLPLFLLACVTLFADSVFSSIDSTSNGCNCTQCDSAIVGFDCIRDPLKFNSTCNSVTGECYVKTPYDTILVRGCVGDAHVPTLQDCNDEENCVICFDQNNCNGLPWIREKCYDIAYNPGEMTLNHFDLLACPLSTKLVGCYTLYDQETKRIRKGCVKALSKNDRDNCEVGKNCEICYGDGCNYRN